MNNNQAVQQSFIDTQLWNALISKVNEFHSARFVVYFYCFSTAITATEQLLEEVKVTHISATIRLVAPIDIWAFSYFG